MRADVSQIVRPPTGAWCRTLGAGIGDALRRMGRFWATAVFAGDVRPGPRRRRGAVDQDANDHQDDIVVVGMISELMIIAYADRVPTNHQRHGAH